jgi:hypothetical protein
LFDKATVSDSGQLEADPCIEGNRLGKEAKLVVAAGVAIALSYEGSMANVDDITQRPLEETGDLS